MTEAGAKRAETSLFNSRLMRIDPIAIPIEKMAMKRLATCSFAPSTFFTSGGKMMISTAPMVQKKLIEQIARNSRGMCIVALTSRTDARMMWRSNGMRSAAGGAGGTSRPVRKPSPAMPTVAAAAVAGRTARIPARIVPPSMAM